MTITPTITEDLRVIARQYVALEVHTDDLELSDMLMRTAAQLRFIARLADEAKDGRHDEMATDFTVAGRSFLAAVEEQLMTEVHESRASRRVSKTEMPKPNAPLADRLAWARRRDGAQL